MYGKIVSHWKIENGNMVYTIEIPANTSANIILPKAKVNEIEMDASLNKLARQVKNAVEIKLGSGKYIFAYPFQGEL